MMDYDVFITYYNEWENDCKQELREKNYTEDVIDDCSICENGQVYFGNLMITEDGFVTSWENSKHFIDVYN